MQAFINAALNVSGSFEMHDDTDSLQELTVKWVKFYTANAKSNSSPAALHQSLRCVWLRRSTSR